MLDIDNKQSEILSIRSKLKETHEKSEDEKKKLLMQL
jgi:hypothetical protein